MSAGPGTTAVAVVVEEIGGAGGIEEVVRLTGTPGVATGIVDRVGTGSAMVGASATDAQAESISRAPMVAFRTQPVWPTAGRVLWSTPRRLNGRGSPASAAATPGAGRRPPSTTHRTRIALCELLRSAASPQAVMPSRSPAGGAPNVRSLAGAAGANGGGAAAIDPDAAYATLAAETGIAEDKLREVILYEPDGVVHILPVGRLLGSANSEKTRNIATLIVGARYAGLHERSVNIEHVRSECIDKKCYDSGNFKSNHIGKHDGFSVRGDELYVNPSKWLALFQSAVATARGVGDS